MLLYSYITLRIILHKTAADTGKIYSLVLLAVEQATFGGTRFSVGETLRDILSLQLNAESIRATEYLKF